jgi:hypothetical protein
VITGHHHVELAAARADKDSIARKRPRHVNPGGAARFNGRYDRGLFFAPEQAVFAGVRIQSGHRDARRRDAEARKRARREHDGGLERRPGERARHIGERDVHGRQHDAESVGVEHHRDVGRPGQMRQQIGVSRSTAGPRARTPLC